MTGHLLLETLLVVVIFYLLLQQSYTPENRTLTETVSCAFFLFESLLCVVVDVGLKSWRGGWN